eukprot:scaffold33957_cov36-Tisochrysis_lutea.AAC.2
MQRAQSWGHIPLPPDAQPIRRLLTRKGAPIETIQYPVRSTGFGGAEGGGSEGERPISGTAALTSLACLHEVFPDWMRRRGRSECASSTSGTSAAPQISAASTGWLESEAGAEAEGDAIKPARGGESGG